MRTLHFIALVFMWQVVLVVEGQVVEGEGHEVWVSPLAVSYSGSVKDSNDTEDDLQEDHIDLRSSPHYLVELPTLYCDYDEQCMAQDIDFICVDGECTCRPPLCWVYQYEVTGFFTAKYIFTCQQCGILGSRCNGTEECFYPGECWEDEFCHCPSGENYDGVCYSYTNGWSNTLAMSAIGLIIVCGACILGVNCYLDPPWRNPNAWRCGCCSNREETSHGRVRRGSCEKSPAYTIQLHYASRDNTAFENDPQDAVLVGAQGGVPQQQQQRGRSSGSVGESANSGTVSSVSSANTNVTTVSRTESTDTSPPSHPPPPYSTLPRPSHNAPKSPPHTDISLSSSPPVYDDASGGAAALPPYAVDGPSTSYASSPPPVSHNPPSPLPLSPHYPGAASSTSSGDPTPPASFGFGQSSSSSTPPSSPDSLRSISAIGSPSSLTPPPSPISPRSSSSLPPSSSSGSPSSSSSTPNSLRSSSSLAPSSSVTPSSPRSSSSSLAPSSLTPPSSGSNSPKLSSSSLVPPSRNYSKSHKKSSVGNDDSDIQLQEITPKSSSSPRSPNKTEDAPGDVSMSCTHERCQLCLPRSPSSRPPPPAVTPRRKPKPKPKPRTDNSASYTSHQEDIQLTQL